MNNDDDFTPGSKRIIMQRYIIKLVLSDGEVIGNECTRYMIGYGIRTVIKR